MVNTKSKLTINDTVFMNVNATNYMVKFPTVMRLSDRDINTIKNVLTQSKKRDNYIMCSKVALKIKEVLKIEAGMDDIDF
ncbi:MAG: hypothetical protein IPJ81_04920 [Chitinophagaceae bacterium]|nr:hypothetical protein [Chitinophagaceae bacterium]